MGHASYKVFTPVAITTAFTNADAALMQSASQYFNIPFDKLPAAFIYYLHVGLATNFNPAHVGPPPPGARPVIITTNWLPNTAALVRFDASRYGLSGEDYHWFAGRLAAALYLLWSPH